MTDVYIHVNSHSNQDIEHFHHTRKFPHAPSQSTSLKSKTTTRDFPGGTVVKNPSANAGDMGSIPGPGRSHMPRSN